MTTELTNDEINVKLAEALGWTRLRQDDGWSESICKTHMGKPGEDLIASPPNYTGSYDAVMGEVEKLTFHQKEKFTEHLLKRLRGSAHSGYCDCATAGKKDRALALLATLSP